MNRADVPELHYIAALGNVPSILQHGVVCYREAQKLPHHSVASQEVQDLRHVKLVPPGTRTIHDFANLYFHARNPMMFARQQYHQSLCVLRLQHDVLDLPGVMLSDQNAASKWARYFASPAGLQHLDKDRIYARDWRSTDTIDYWRRKSAKCAEVLVPDVVSASFIAGAYISGPEG